MKKIISRIFSDCGLEVGFADFAEVRFSEPEKEYFTVLVTYLPYYFPQPENANICKYASLPDYHDAFSEKLEVVAEKLRETFPDNVFDVYVDKSPVDEKKAALRAGLGVKGRNSLLITKKHGSFVFLGSVCSDIRIGCDSCPDSCCENCGLCERSCPVGAIADGKLDFNLCLSAVTQRKGELTDAEKVAIRKSGIAWGCDVCQNVCPNNRPLAGLFSEFAGANRDNLIYRLEPEQLQGLTERQFREKFRGRAFIWRGRKTLLRDLEIVSGEDMTSH